MKSVMVISKALDVFQTIHSCFRSSQRVDRAFDKKRALDMLQKKRYDLIFIDLEILVQGIPDQPNKTVFEPFWHLYPSIEIIVMTHQNMLRKAVGIVKAGARDYLSYPIDPVEVKHIIENITETILMESELDYLRDRFWLVDSLELVKTKSAHMQKVFDKIRSVSPTKSTVLLIGETGTGKNLLAKLIHQHSNRKEAQFISVHCGAIPDTLLESELFGHEKGAFTGAVRRKLGKFEIAKGGTIFLDEIGTITPSAQIKLLQILQDGTFQRVGGEETLDANVRVIAATNTNLKKMCDDGEFRKDLYYRLNVFPIEIPRLVERKEDIINISNVILTKLDKLNSKAISAIHPHVLAAFEEYEWPGNIRELENLIERAYILETSCMLTPESFPKELFEAGGFVSSPSLSSPLTLSQARQQGIEDIERNYIKELLSKHKGKINDSAKEAGISTRQLNKLMNKYEIRKEEFKPISRQ
jgi:DNA-binding NtrC family response regulator